MTIQLSIIVWTVICFTALIFILKYLLFRPIFRIMDERKEKIESAKLRKTEFEEAEKSALKNIDSEIEKSKRQFSANEKRVIESEREKAHNELHSLTEEEFQKVNSLSDELSSEKSKMSSELEKDIGMLADAFIDGLTL